MRKIFEKNTVLGLLFICIITIGSCNIPKKLDQKNSDRVKAVYIDSVMIKMPRVVILSEELKTMLDTLIHEASIYEPMRGFPDYTAGISISTNKVHNNLIKLSMGKNYIMSYCFPNAEKDNPFYPNIYPLIPSKLGLSKYRGYQIDYLWTMKYFIFDNGLGNPEIIKVERDSIQLTGYATRTKETNEWMYMLMPSVTLYCEVVGDKLIFERFEYDDGSIKYVE